MRLRLVAAVVLGAVPMFGQPLEEAPLAARALISRGDTARTQQALARARRGEPVTIAVIGGSITQGALASTPARNYGSLLADWWRTTFPQAEVTFRNDGIGATGSLLAAHRCGPLVAAEPDLVVVEFAVNDPNDESATESLEGLVRQLLDSPHQPAVVLLYTMNSLGGNVQAHHARVGLRYGLPQISFRDALWPEVQAGRIAWNDIEADEVHPNDRGHAYLAEFLTYYLESVRANLPADEALPKIPPRRVLPTPVTSDVYQFAQVLTADQITPIASQGFRHEAAPFGPGWVADDPGSYLEFEIEAERLAALHYRIKGDTGIARLTVDDRPPVTLNAWFDATWGGYWVSEPIAADLGPGPHRVRLELTDELPGTSTAHRFHLGGLLVAGTR